MTLDTKCMDSTQQTTLFQVILDSIEQGNNTAKALILALFLHYYKRPERSISPRSLLDLMTSRNPSAKDRHLFQAIQQCTEDPALGLKERVFNTLQSDESIRNNHVGIVVRALCYTQGCGTEKDDNKAFQLYTLASEYRVTNDDDDDDDDDIVMDNDGDRYENAHAMHQLASIYYDRKDDEEGSADKIQNTQIALRYYERACEMNHSVALNDLGYHYDVLGDVNKALVLWERAIQLGNRTTYCNMSDLYGRERINSGDSNPGESIENPLYDPERAWYYLQQSAKLGSSYAHHLIVCTYIDGKLGAVMDAEKLQYHRDRSIAMGCAIAMNHRGYVLEVESDIPDLPQSIHLYTKASELGNSTAYCNLAEIYENGAVIAPNRERAIALYEKSAALDNTYAMQALAALYQCSKDHEPEFDKVEYWYREIVAQKRDPKSAHQLAQLYIKHGGRFTGREQDIVSLLHQSAEQDYFPSLSLLASIYLGGHYSVRPDIEKADSLAIQCSDMRIRGMCALFRDLKVVLDEHVDNNTMGRDMHALLSCKEFLVHITPEQAKIVVELTQHNTTVIEALIDRALENKHGDFFINHETLYQWCQYWMKAEPNNDYTHHYLKEIQYQHLKDICGDDYSYLSLLPQYLVHDDLVPFLRDVFEGYS